MRQFAAIVNLLPAKCGTGAELVRIHHVLPLGTSTGCVDFEFEHLALVNVCGTSTAVVDNQLELAAKM